MVHQTVNSYLVDSQLQMDSSSEDLTVPPAEAPPFEVRQRRP